MCEIGAHAQRDATHRPHTLIGEHGAGDCRRAPRQQHGTLQFAPFAGGSRHVDGAREIVAQQRIAHGHADIA